jgi:hypothetical protein
LLTGATDGYIAFWPLTSITPLIDNNNNNYNDDAKALTTVKSIEWTIHHAIHTRTIKSLETIKLSSTCQLLIGGGDDNSLSVTTFFQDNSGEPTIATVSVPNAHASAITAVKILDVATVQNDGNGGTNNVIVVNVASSGNDQRVKLWRVSIDSSTKLPEKAIRVCLNVDWYCAVADVAAMDVMEINNNDDEKERVLIVGGVGMEMLKLVAA